MKVSLKDQMVNPAVPVKCVTVRTGSALPLELVGIPSVCCGMPVDGVSVRVVNADGVGVEAPCERAGCVWRVLFAATNFAHYGFVSLGLRVVLRLVDSDGLPNFFTLGVGDFEVLSASADAQPGNPGAHYVSKGGDLYVKSRVVDGVQHYLLQTMEFVEDMGWGANWTGDYILAADGEFVPANNQEGE